MARDQCVAQAAVRLMLQYPLWCELYYTMTVVETARIPTLATDGKRLFVNPKYWEKLEFKYRVTALAHEATHKMLHHCTRGIHHIQPWSNIAMDIVVHNLLSENKFPIHPNWVQPEPKYKDWTYDAIYADIIKDLPPQQKQGGKGNEGKGGDEGEPDDTGSGFCDDPGIPSKYQGAWRDVQAFKGSQEEIEAFEAKVEEQVQQAIAAAKLAGNMPVGVEMAMSAVTKIAEERWYDHLHRFFQSLRLAEYDWRRLNRRYLIKHRVLAPSQYTERLGPVLIFVDASGSCYSVAQQAQFISHINAILSEAKPSKVQVAYFDTRVHKCVEMDPGEIEFNEQPSGGGGTDFSGLFEWAEQNGIYPDVGIVLTDMYGAFPKEEPGYPVIWVSTTPNAVAPIGETIYIGER